MKVTRKLEWQRNIILLFKAGLFRPYCILEIAFCQQAYTNRQESPEPWFCPSESHPAISEALQVADAQLQLWPRVPRPWTGARHALTTGCGDALASSGACQLWCWHRPTLLLRNDWRGSRDGRMHRLERKTSSAVAILIHRDAPLQAGGNATRLRVWSLHPNPGHFTKPEPLHSPGLMGFLSPSKGGRVLMNDGAVLNCHLGFWNTL